MLIRKLYEKIQQTIKVSVSLIQQHNKEVVNSSLKLYRNSIIDMKNTELTSREKFPSKV